MSTKSKKSQKRNTHKKSQFRKIQGSQFQHELSEELVSAISDLAIGETATVATFIPATYIKGLTPKNMAGFFEVTFPCGQFAQMAKFIHAMNYSPKFEHVEYLTSTQATDPSDLHLFTRAGIAPNTLMTMVFAVSYRTAAQKAAA